MQFTLDLTQKLIHFSFAAAINKLPMGSNQILFCLADSTFNFGGLKTGGKNTIMVKSQ